MTTLDPSPDGLPVRALFQQRIAGDDALLQLARLRFEQAGLGAEAYADSPAGLERVLGFVASSRRLPTVHLSREVDVLDQHGRNVVEDFARGFAGRVYGLVVHDSVEMGANADALVAGLRELSARLDDGPHLFLEYAAGLDPEWFVDVGRRLRDVEHVSLCIDVGHLGIRQAEHNFAAAHPGIELGSLGPQDPRLPDLAADVQGALQTALPTVLEMIRALGPLGNPLHFHLHDGHPLIPGLHDHFSFLTQVPIPFDFEGQRSLPTLYGPTGLAEIVAAAVESADPEHVSFTLEIHQAEGRLPLADGAALFRHWSDKTNAERMNHWLAVLAQNALLVRSSLSAAQR